MSRSVRSHSGGEIGFRVCGLEASACSTFCCRLFVIVMGASRAIVSRQQPRSSFHALSSSSSSLVAENVVARVYVLL